MNTYAIRRETILPTGEPANFGHDTIRLGWWSDRTRTHANIGVNSARCRLMELLDYDTAQYVLDQVALYDAAFAVAPGIATRL